MPKLSVDGYELYYEVDGSGPPLVFIHGAWVDNRMWAAQVRHFRSHYRVITFDVRGHGRSGRCQEGCTIDRFTDDLEALLSFLNAKRAIVCGLSLGGLIAQTYAVRHPTEIRALVLADTVRSVPPIDPIARWKHLLFPKPFVYGTIQATGVDSYFESLLLWVEGFEGHHWLALSEEVRTYAMNEIGRFSVAEFVDVLDAFYQFSSLDLTVIDVPILLLTGDHETDAVIRQNERMSRLLANCSWDTIQYAGHLSNMDNATQFNAALNDFLAGLAE